MTEWSRRALLRLIDEAADELRAPQRDAIQRRALMTLLGEYASKVKSIHASDVDVQRMKEQLAQILGTGDRIS